MDPKISAKNGRTRAGAGRETEREREPYAARETCNEADTVAAMGRLERPGQARHKHDEADDEDTEDGTAQQDDGRRTGQGCSS